MTTTYNNFFTSGVSGAPSVDLTSNASFKDFIKYCLTNSGWVTEFENTNNAIFKSSSLSNPNFRVRVQNDGLVHYGTGTLSGYCAMSGGYNVANIIDVMDKNKNFFFDLTSVTSSSKAWFVGNEKGFYLFTEYLTTGNFSGACYFGDIKPLNSNDPETITVICATSQTQTTINQLMTATNVNFVFTDHWMTKSFDNIKSWNGCAKTSLIPGQVYTGQDGFAYPNLSNQVDIDRCCVISNYQRRGYLPMWNPLNNIPFSNLDTCSITGSGIARSFIVFKHTSNGSFLIETTNHWFD